jgi:hypothetical protein
MYHYCTLFDSNYLSRGLALHRSLKKNCQDFHLYIFSFDEISRNILESLKLNHVTIISLSEFEDPDLLAIKNTRTKGEYCWTCTPSTIVYCIQKFGLKACTYIDADLFFFSDPNILIDEMGGKSVLITEHRYTKRYDKSARSGIYCVQFITFKNDKNGMTALTWWRDRCLEWCYDRKEDGKFGDQKYLDDWTERFEGIHVLEHLGGGVAPWNVQQYAITKEHETIQVVTPALTTQLIFYHFHYIKFYKDDQVDLGNYKLRNSDIEIVYRPYLLEMTAIETMLIGQFQFGRKIQKYFYKNMIMTLIHRYGRKLLGIFNVYYLSDIKNGTSY